MINSYHFLKLVLFGALLLLLTSCGSNHTSILEHRITEYNFSKPVVSYFLPDSLDEISGITFMNDTQIACIHDERGTLYIFDIVKDTFVNEIPLVKEGDYEDLAIADGKLYILNSKGNLLAITNYLDSTTAIVEKVKTSLKKDNDTEGLVYDRRLNSLLVASKKSSGKEMKGKKGVYAYSLATGETSLTPYISIDIKELKDSMSDGLLWDATIKVADFFSGSGDGSLFQPAGIAIHPFSGDYYILSSANRLLLVVSPQLKWKHLVALPTRYFYQPEGITFAPNGDLYICTEKGKRTKAAIIKYTYNDSTDIMTEIKTVKQ